MEENKNQNEINEHSDEHKEDQDEKIIAQQQQQLSENLSNPKGETEKPKMEETVTKEKPDLNQETVTATEKPKKAHKPMKRILVPIISVVAAMVISTGCGYLGATWANSKQSPSGSVVVYQNTDAPVNVTTTSDTTDVSAVVKAVEDSVVEVYTEMAKYSAYFGNYVKQGAGSGVVYSSDGYIITNNHVIESATSIKVTLHNGDSYDATLIATDPTADIAIIKINVTGLTPAVFGDSDKLQVGQESIVIGNPLGTLGGTVTTGIISALSREVTVDGQKMTLMQTNAAINPGNSGGGLFSSTDQLIGIVNAKSTATEIEGIGFAIPINVVKSVAEELIGQGYVSGRPLIGISYVSIDSVQQAWQYNVSTYGVYVSGIVSDNAEKAGLQVGDVITKLDDTTIASASDLSAALSVHKVGDTVQLTIVRQRETLKVSVELTERTANTSTSAN